ncbi:diguanylate cyclase (GGDEF)-like protein/PAS domain S-box-containing protein [Oxalobacteraceae bacterium GrIS 1.11]
MDAVSGQICVLDKHGNVLAVNQAWRDFHDMTGEGGNYLQRCDALGAPASRQMAAGIRQVSAQECPRFTLEFSCDGAHGQRCLLANVTRFHGDSGNIVITQEDISERRRMEQALRDSEARWQFALEGSGKGVWDLDVAGNTVFLSSGWKKILGYADDEIGSSVAEWYAQVHPDDAASVRADLQAHLDGGPSTEVNEHRVRRKDGSYIWVQAQGLVVSRDPGGRALRMVGTLSDVSARRAAERRLQLAASVFTCAREGIMITDAAGTIVEVNDTFSAITGYSRAEALGQNPRMLKSGRQPPQFYAAMWQALREQGHWFGEAWNRRKDGTVYAELITISAVRDAAGQTQNYVALFTDITHMKQYLEQIERVAHYDALTGLPNRVLLAERMRHDIAQCQRRKQSLAVLYLDLDGFKGVNDHHGHEVGDALLIALAQRLQHALREGDTMARIGGDEFVAVLVDLERPQDCEPVLARLLQAAATKVQIGPLALQVSASIGVTLYPQDGADADVLMRHADQAMYLAKQGGKNRYHLFDVGRDEAARSHREQLEQIRAALAHDEFVLYYQPKVNMRSGAVIGAEALIRWRHPQRGLLPPGDFLPAIEEHPISVELGEWVIATALRQVAAWRTEGLELPVSVNVGALQLQRADFRERLATLLAAQPDVAPNCLELEILETSALGDIAPISELMHACRALGVSFALDDFGTGYSSLTYLKRLPAELLKIDQSFVRGMLDDPDSLAIIEGVVGLAAAFGRSVIAEGVETVAHGELLLPLGCELAQGFGVARPMPAAALPAWALNWRPDPAWSAWRERPLNRDHVLVVFVEVEHRHWLGQIDAFLAGAADATAPPNRQNCHFSRWHQNEGRILYGANPEFARTIAMHEQVHQLGGELIQLHIEGRRDDAQASLSTLHDLRDALIEQLRRLIR